MTESFINYLMDETLQPEINSDPFMQKLLGIQPQPKVTLENSLEVVASFSRIKDLLLDLAVRNDRREIQNNEINIVLDLLQYVLDNYRLLDSIEQHKVTNVMCLISHRDFYPAYNEFLKLEYLAEPQILTM
jgi:hypothetical protein